MRVFTVLFVCAVMATGITAMADCGADHGSAAKAATEADASSAETITCEIACASCIYSKEGIKGCYPALKIDGEVLMLIGGSVDAHEHGLCKAAKQAKVAGKAVGDTFEATEVEVID